MKKNLKHQQKNVIYSFLSSLFSFIHSHKRLVTRLEFKDEWRHVLNQLQQKCECDKPFLLFVVPMPNNKNKKKSINQTIFLQVSFWMTPAGGKCVDLFRFQLTFFRRERNAHTYIHSLSLQSQCAMHRERYWLINCIFPVCLKWIKYNRELPLATILSLTICTEQTGRQK